ncbi:MAG: FAD:protein FMN transferase [Actinomycetota bacterium]|nr:FAD:protein FMN transferase [Actinomycetota bacterium]
MARPVVVTGQAMATRISVRTVDRGPDAARAARAALATFSAVERSCSRFDERSPLATANRRPGRWHHVDQRCYAALRAAAAAHQASGGRFDPRVHDRLVALGYDRTFADVGDRPSVGASRSARSGRGIRRRGPWRPRLRGGPRPEVFLGPVAVDLGGIGKGLALRWAATRLAAAGAGLIEAGGDCIALGRPVDADAWMVGVEDPLGVGGPVAVLALTDRACATSSIRVRRWRDGHRVVHHLIDPATGEPGGEGLAAVTVVGRDAAAAEVWSKCLFLAGADGVAAAAARRGLAALWVTDAGEVGWSRPMGRWLAWAAR